MGQPTGCQSSWCERLVRECESSGALAMFSAVICGMNSRPPKDIKAYFTRFVTEAKFTLIDRAVLSAYKQKFGRIVFVSALGVSMGHRNGKPICFVKTREIILNSPRQRVPVRQPQVVHIDRAPARRPQVGQLERRVRGGAYVPHGNRIFDAALAGQDWRQLSHGGPKGHLRRR